MEVDCKEQVIGLALHPSAGVAAAGLATGKVQLWNFGGAAAAARTEQAASASASASASKRAPVLSQTLSAHAESCRVARFSGDGSHLVTGAADGSLKSWDASAQQGLAEAWGDEDAHEAGVNSLCCLEPDGDAAQAFLSGDEDGRIKLWDLRQRRAALSAAHEQKDFIADMLYSELHKTVLAASGDGTLAAYQLKMGLQKVQLLKRSAMQEDEMLSLQLIRSGKKVLVGTQAGVLNIYDWGNWEDVTDRFPGHPTSIDAMVGVDETTVCTGSSDGIMRVVSLFPHKLVGVLGDHMGFPIERLEWTHDRSHIVSTSHDSIVRFWDAGVLADDSDDSDDDDDDDEAVAHDAKAPANEKQDQDQDKKQEDDQGDDQGDDDDDDDGDDDDDDEEAEEAETKSKKRKISKPLSAKNLGAMATKKVKKKQGSAFYADMM